MTLTPVTTGMSLPGAPVNLTWDGSGTLLAFAHATTPFLTQYRVSGATFTKLPAPAVLPSGDATGVAVW